jgi:hypothetical protein
MKKVVILLLALAMLAQPVFAASSDYLHSSEEVQSSDPGIVSLAKDITRNVYSEYSQAKAINDWVSRNIKYDTKSANEARKVAPIERAAYLPRQDAISVMQRRTAVCDGFAKLTAALLRADGIQSQIAIGYLGGELHAWVEAYVAGRWINMDPTAEATGGNKKSYFDVADFWTNRTPSHVSSELTPSAHRDHEDVIVTQPIAVTAAEYRSAKLRVDKPKGSTSYRVDTYVYNTKRYFKLRDLAAMFDGTHKEFVVKWAKGSVLIERGNYQYTGTELKCTGVAGKNIAFSPHIYFTGERVSVTGLSVDGVTYVTLEDIERLLDFKTLNVDKNTTQSGSKERYDIVIEY